MQASCTRPVLSLGTRMLISARLAAFPPWAPVSATVVIPAWLAASSARTTLSELPEVLRPTTTSPGLPTARTWRAKTSS